ncbi:hypothetical protein Cantr_10544 [Candida viswanathii]|uniref:Uncharacterized protein n=1 Tax=Candida viswanathii TaxID=5486 RepID=A0A367YDI6_9ASCO|nr:hypothetical protein Cantr_10544 [Candida viswanathii]
MLLKHMLRRSHKLIKHKVGAPSVYYARAVVASQSSRESFEWYRYGKRLFRSMATSCSDTYDFDYDALEATIEEGLKNKKKTRTSGLNIDVLALFGSISLLKNTKIDPVLLEKKLYKTFLLKILDPNGVLLERLDINSKRGQKMIDFVHQFYPELQDFEEFLKTKYNNKKMQIGLLSVSETVNDFIQFQHYCSGDAGISRDKISRYHEMEEPFVAFLNEVPNSPRILSKELVPVIESYNKFLSFFQNEFHWFKPELLSLDQEFNFKKVRSIKNLATELERRTRKFVEYLSAANKVDKTFFKVLIQRTRQGVLTKKFKGLTDLSLKDIRNILYDPDYMAYESTIVQECIGSTTTGSPLNINELEQKWAAGLFHFLQTMKLIPSTGDYYKLAPALYELTQERNMYGTAASGLLATLTNREVEMQSNAINGVIDKHHFEIHDFSNDMLTNYLLSFLIHIDFPWYVALSEKGSISQSLEHFEKPIENLALYELFISNEDYIKQAFSNPKITAKFLMHSSFPPCYCIPQNCGIWKDIIQLKAIRKQLGRSFDSYTDVSELRAAIRRLGPHYERVCANIVAASDYFANNLYVLDNLVDSQSGAESELATEGPAGSGTTETYSQIPDWFKLENHIPEIRFLKSEVGSFSNKEYVLTSLDSLSDDMIAREEAFPDIDVNSFLKLRSKLREFSTNNNSSCLEVLDAVLHNQDAFSKFEASLAKKTVTTAEPEIIEPEVINESKSEEAPYVQIPDDLKLHEFTKELSALKSVLGRRFSEVSAEEILKVLQNNIDGSFANGATRSSLLGSNASDVFNFLRLSRRLQRLFDTNGNNTESLDVLLNSQAVFDSFEASKKPAEYKQIPSDFVLEEYFMELSELKKALGIAKFAQATSEDVLKKVKELSEDSSNGTSKNLIWSKLYRNLSMLFKHNHGATFVLDNVIGSAQEYLRFESNRVETERAQSAIGSQGALLSGSEYEALGDFLRYSDLLYRSDVHKVSAKQFDEMLDRFEESLDKTSSTYLFTKSVLDQLKKYNADIEFYPPFIVCIYGTNCLGDFPMSPIQLEMFYHDLIRSLNETTADEKKTVKQEDTTEMLDIGKLTSSITEKTKYNNSEKIISDLDKESTGADFEAIQLAVHSAFEAPEQPILAPVRAQLKKEPKLEKKKAIKPLTESYSSHEVDKSKLEKYLQEAKKQVESKIREREAYEWSKKVEMDSKRAKINSKYCLLTLEGDMMPISQQALNNLPNEDIFKTLNKFSKEELSKASEVVKDLQARNWKVVGSRVEGDKKYLVLTNNDSTGRTYKALRSLLATTGLVFLTVIGVNLWVNESEQFNRAITEHEKNEASQSAGASPFSVSTVASPVIFGKEHVSGIVDEGSSTEKEQANTLSWWQRLFWTK